MTAAVTVDVGAPVDDWGSEYARAPVVIIRFLKQGHVLQEICDLGDTHRIKHPATRRRAQKHSFIDLAKLSGRDKGRTYLFIPDSYQDSARVRLEVRLNQMASAGEIEVLGVEGLILSVYRAELDEDGCHRWPLSSWAVAEMSDAGLLDVYQLMVMSPREFGPMPEVRVAIEAELIGRNLDVLPLA